MKFGKLKSLILLFVLFFTAPFVMAQKYSFAYFESANFKPFYVKLGNKVFSSSPNGYLILSKLENGKYPIKLGYAQQTKEQDYELVVQDGDQGFIIQNFGEEKGMGLFNLQKMSVQYDGAYLKKPVADVAKVEIKAPVKEAPKQEEIKTEVIQQVTKVEKERTEVNATPVKEIIEDKPKEVAIKTEPVINKVSNSEASRGTIKSNNDNTTVISEAKKEPAKPVQSESIVIEKEKPKETKPVAPRQRELKFLDMDLDYDSTSKIKSEPIAKPKPQIVSNNSNTIVEAITPEVKKPEEKVAAKADTLKEGLVKEVEVKVDSVVEKVVKEAINVDTLKEALVKEEVKVDTLAEKVADKPVEVAVKDTNVVEIKEQPVAARVEIVPVAVPEKKVANVTTAGNCGEPATAADITSLRRRMIMGEDSEEMLEFAKRPLSQKCYVTNDVLKLSQLFITEKYKYEFFKLAYNNISDKENFKSLESIFTTNEWKASFNKLTESK